ncbi:Uncharacterized protein dnm_028760 [Desulfonema magnum]|uniref:Uncharacterized protein n=1 Tax=Desulfonema magnum TaxID=45655 RepID=A0A975BKA5_9BACT|nr:Uncharacterized protein dnm_028760 [Desulfonema magnum]
MRGMKIREPDFQTEDQKYNVIHNQGVRENIFQNFIKKYVAD